MLQAKKSLGQHFLIDPRAHERIVKAVAPTADDVVIEIGPGTGLLTKHLIASPLKKLVAFELDSRAVPLLIEQFPDERFELREQDFLEINLLGIAAGFPSPNPSREREGNRLKVVGNIPYYITSPILFKLIDERAAVSTATLLLQREVADRLVASPSTKAYGIPTVLANFFGEVKFLFKVPAGAFRPVPNVDSAVVQIDFARDFFSRTGTARPGAFDEEKFRSMVRTLFNMRRKTIRNNLKSMASSEQVAALEESDAKRYLDLRAEALTIQDFLNLYQSVSVSGGE
jgi:16S rRNA (adenine1518-N6/adenine1519-N6)-dimethyltransferase